MPRQRNNPSGTMSNQGDKVIQKENEKSPKNKHKDKKDCELKMAVLRKLDNTQENSERQFSELRNKTNITKI